MCIGSRWATTLTRMKWFLMMIYMILYYVALRHLRHMSQYTWVTNKNCTTLALVKLGSGQLYPLQESISNSEIIENDFPLIIENYTPHPFFFLNASSETGWKCRQRNFLPIWTMSLYFHLIKRAFGFKLRRCCRGKKWCHQPWTHYYLC